MCDNLKNSNLKCIDDGSVLEIKEAYIGQDFDELLKCGWDVRDFQNPCKTYPDVIKKTKLKCDGRKSCNINDSLVVETCPNHKRYFHVEFSCQANLTKGDFLFSFDKQLTANTHI